MVVRFSPFSLALSQQPHNHQSSCFSKQVSVSCSYGMKRFDLGRPQILSPALRNSDGLRVFVVSDLHTDYDENLKWVECLSTVNYKDDVLLVAGDVAETYNMFVVTMSLLRERFEHVFYVPGNHDLWCRREGQNYVRSLYSNHDVQIHALCRFFDTVFRHNTRVNPQLSLLKIIVSSMVLNISMCLQYGP
jgi:predicted MPP superfamily phosphohydrolase